MAKPIAVVTSDCHLDDYAWANRKDLCGDGYYAFTQIVDYAVQHKLPIIAAGDLLDKKENNSSPVFHMGVEIDRMRTPGLDFYYIQGQHELQETPWLAIRDWATWLTEAEFGLKLGKHNLGGFDWCRREKLLEQLSYAPKELDILVMHQVCGDFMGSVVVPELMLAEVPHVKLLIIGDYHKHLQLATHNKQGDPMLVLSPGSTHMRSIDEPAEKFFFVLNDNLTAESVPIRSRVCRKPRALLLPEQLDDFIQAIPRRMAKDAALSVGLPESLQKAIWRITYDSSIPKAYERICDALQFRVHRFLKEVSPDFDEEESEQTEIKLAGEMDLVTCLSEVVPDTESKLFQVTKRLLEVDVSKQQVELAEIRKEYGVVCD